MKSQLGPDNCSATVSIDQPQSRPVTVYVPSGTVCLECIIDGVLATDASFLIRENLPVPPSNGTVVNGTLVVFDSERVFSTPTLIQCGPGGTSTQHRATVVHSSKFT